MQDTKTFTLPVSKKSVVIKGYMSGRVDQEIQRILMGKNKTHFETDVNPSEGTSTPATPKSTKSFMDVDPTVTIDAENKKIELMVVSVGASQIDVLNQVLDLPKEDVQYIQDQISNVEQDSKVEGSDPKVPTS